VVEGGSACGAVKDTTSVVLEGGLVSFNGNGGWSSLDGGHESRGGSSGDGGSGSAVVLALVVTAVAGSGLGGVGVVSFELGLIGLIPDEGTLHGTTIASLRAEVVAVNEFLFREGNKISGLDLVGTFHSSGGGEGPAGSTLSLILNWSDSSCGNPVN